MALNGIAHKNLTDPQIHEPKGASTAEAGQVPFADGEGHTAWGFITPDKLVIVPAAVNKSTANSSTIPTTLDVLAYSGYTPSNAMSIVTDMTGVNQQLTNLSDKLNKVITPVSTLKASYNDLAAKYDALIDALEALGFISTGA